MSAITEQKCPHCGGAVEFNVGAQKLKCPYCDAEFDIAAMQQAEDFAANTVEQINWNSQGSQWGAGETDGMSVYACNSCGGEIVADQTTGATSCPYCGNQVVMKGQFSGALKPDLVIPFKLDKKAAKEALKKHFRGKKFVPKAFLAENKLDEVKGVYVPHWLFSCDAVVNATYQAEKYKHWSDSKNEYTETTAYNVYRSGSIGFDNVPVDGSTKMPDDLMESIEPFNLNEAVPFNTAYLAGYLADKYDVDVNQSMGRANERIQASALDAFEDTVEGYNAVTPMQAAMQVANGSYKYALYPVWILNVKWKGQNHTFAMNGQTGKFVGNIPTEEKKAKLIGGLGGAAVGALIYIIINIISSL
ncbi:MAG: hypothetical protein IKJ41_05640 [Clostridia bacterium]|nr:hypothetical protein [Clostridia bacterium]